MAQTVETSELTDGVLLKQLSAGDKAAWDTLVRRHADTVYSVVSRIVRRQSDADDAGQEAFLRLKEYAHTFDGARYGENARNWIATIACREALKINARRSASRDVPYDDELGGGAANTGSVENSKVEDREVQTLLRQAVESLPQRQREAIVMHFAAGMTQMEIAAELGCDQSTISDRIRQGLDKLRQRLGGADVAMAIAPAMLIASLQQKAPAAFVHALLNHSAWAPAAAAGAKAAKAGAAISTTKAVLWILAVVAALTVGFSALNRVGVKATPPDELGSFESNTAEGWESVDGASISVVEEHATDGKRALRVDITPAKYPGVRKKFERPADWRKFRALRATVYCSAAEPLNLSIRCDDDKSTSYGSRFNFDDAIRLQPGANVVELSLASVWNGSALSRGLSADKVSQLCFFVNGARKPVTLWLDRIQLVPNRTDVPDVVELLQPNPHIDPVGSAAFKPGPNDGALEVTLNPGQPYAGFELFTPNDWLSYDELSIQFKAPMPALPGGISVKLVDTFGRKQTVTSRAVDPNGKVRLPLELFGHVALGHVRTVSVFCESVSAPQTVEVRQIQLLKCPLIDAPSRHDSATYSDPLSLDFTPIRQNLRTNSFQALVWIPETGGAFRAVRCNSEGIGAASYSIPADDLRNLDPNQRILVWAYFLQEGTWFYKFIEAKKNPDGPLKITFDSLAGWSAR